MIFVTKKGIRNDFDYTNVLETILTIKLNWKWFWLYECIRNNFDNKNELEIILTIKMNWKWFWR